MKWSPLPVQQKLSGGQQQDQGVGYRQPITFRRVRQGAKLEIKVPFHIFEKVVIISCHHDSGTRSPQQLWAWLMPTWATRRTPAGWGGGCSSFELWASHYPREPCQSGTISITTASTSRPRTSISESINKHTQRLRPEASSWTCTCTWASFSGPSDRNYVKEIFHIAVCVHKEVARIGQEFVDMMMVIGQAHWGRVLGGQQALLLLHLIENLTFREFKQIFFCVCI